MGAVPPSVVDVGSGLAGFGVLRELRRLSPDARLTVVTTEDGHFYSKPALSTAFAKGKTAGTLVTSSADKIIAQLKLDARLGRQAEAIDRAGKVLFTTGGPIAYDSLVLAMGASPFRPEIGGDAAHRAIAVNQLDHYAAFREALPEGARVLVMGAGLVGTEFANDLVTSGYRPVVVDMLGWPLAHLVPEDAGRRIETALRDAGVEWHFGRRVAAIDFARPGYTATLDDGSCIEAAVVLSAVGLRPNITLAEEAGLETGAAIKVDRCGRTSDPHIFAIGDCAEYPDGTAAYVTPIMAAARGIALTALGTPTEMKFPPLSVQVKTTLCPVNLLAPPRGAEGAWRLVEDGSAGAKYLFVDTAGLVRGYVVTYDQCEQRSALDACVGSPVESIGQAA